jgi:NAD(P)-dependent dehydrogenase (short-subunit alcohol dehydrogenase family)
VIQSTTDSTPNNKGLFVNKTGLFDLTGQVAVVTGGNGGLGRGIALGLAEAGATIAVLGRNQEKSRAVLSELKALGVRSIAVTIDLTKRDEFEPAFQKVENELGSVDILVNNAGNVSLSGGVMNETPEILLRTPAGRWGQPEELAGTAVFLASRASDFVTGTTVVVDGGYSIR